jgi:hypothetical protein
MTVRIGRVWGPAKGVASRQGEKGVATGAPPPPLRPLPTPTPYPAPPRTPAPSPLQPPPKRKAHRAVGLWRGRRLHFLVLLGEHGGAAVGLDLTVQLVGAGLGEREAVKGVLKARKSVLFAPAERLTSRRGGSGGRQGDEARSLGVGRDRPGPGLPWQAAACPALPSVCRSQPAAILCLGAPPEPNPSHPARARSEKTRPRSGARLDGHARAVEALGEEHPPAAEAVVGRRKLQLLGFKRGGATGDRGRSGGGGGVPRDGCVRSGRPGGPRVPTCRRTFICRLGRPPAHPPNPHSNQSSTHARMHVCN